MYIWIKLVASYFEKLCNPQKWLNSKRQWSVWCKFSYCGVICLARKYVWEETCQHFKHLKERHTEKLKVCCLSFQISERDKIWLSIRKIFLTKIAIWKWNQLSKETVSLVMFNWKLTRHLPEMYWFGYPPISIWTQWYNWPFIGIFPFFLKLDHTPWSNVFAIDSRFDIKISMNIHEKN